MKLNCEVGVRSVNVTEGICFMLPEHNFRCKDISRPSRRSPDHRRYRKRHLSTCL